MLKKSRIISLYVAVLAIASAQCFADDTVKLAISFKKGEVERHKIIVSISLMGMDLEISAVAKSTVKDVKEDGSVTIETVSENTKVKVGGMEIEQPDDTKETATRDKRGRLIEYTAEGGMHPFSPAIEKIQATVQETLLPDKAVKPGDSWTTEFENPAVKDKKLEIKSTFVGIDKLDGVEVWKITQASEIAVNANGDKMTVKSTHWLNPANGHLLKGEGSMKDVPSEQAGSISFDIKLTFIKPEEKKAS